MEIKVELEDEAVCDGCPFHVETKVCGAGFSRETARVNQVKVQDFYYERDALTFSLIRPLACVVATERTNKAIAKLPVRGADNVPGDPASAAPRVKKVFVCSRCQQAHKNYESCRFGGRRG